MNDFAWIALALASYPAMIGLLNLLFVRAPQGRVPDRALVSILIPARDEEATTATCIAHAVGQIGVAVEVLVMDDGSRDRTAEIVAAIAAREPRVRLLACPPRPPGWTDEAHARARLAEAATGTHLLFIDADVRLDPHAAAAMAGQAARIGAGMVTGVPRQRIGSPGEALTVPMIALLWMGYLPGGGRAVSRFPPFAAACGRLMLVTRAAYDRAGGHGAIRGTLHDGIALARRMRAAGIGTDVVDAANLATSRMGRGFAQSWAGFAKHAGGGMATPMGLPVWTVLLAGAHLLPFALLPAPRAVLALALMVALRAAITIKAREPWWTVPLHPFAVAVVLAIQWTALLRAAMGRQASWKGRAHSATGAAGP